MIQTEETAELTAGATVRPPSSGTTWEKESPQNAAAAPAANGNRGLLIGIVLLIVLLLLLFILLILLMTNVISFFATAGGEIHQPKSTRTPTSYFTTSSSRGDLYETLRTECSKPTIRWWGKIKWKRLFTECLKQSVKHRVVQSSLPIPKLYALLAASPHPVLYELEIYPKTQSENGVVRNYYVATMNLTVYVPKKTNKIVLHVNSRFIKRHWTQVGRRDSSKSADILFTVSVHNRCFRSRSICPYQVSEYKNQSLFVFHFHRNLEAGLFYVLVIHRFYSSLYSMSGHPDWLTGLSDGEAEYEEGGLLASVSDDEVRSDIPRRLRTMFPMRRARNAFPCMDEPGWWPKARFRLRLKHSRNEMAFSVGGVKSKITFERKGITMTEFEVTPPMFTYQFWFFTSSSAPYSSTEWNQMNTKFRSDINVKVEICSGQEDLDEKDFVEPKAMKALNIVMMRYVVSAIHWIEQTVKVKFPLEKLTVLIVRHKVSQSGGMGGLGLMVLKWSVLKKFGPRTRIIFKQLVGQWVGAVVSFQSWNQICLQEGFIRMFVTQHFDSTVVGLVQPKSFEKRSRISRRLRRESLRDTGPLVRHFENLKEVERICGSSKAELIFTMIELVAFDEQGINASAKLLEHIVTRHNNGRDFELYSTMGLDDWKKAVKTVTADRKTGEILDTYFTQPGYPIIEARKYEKNGEHTVSLSQRGSVSSVSHVFAVPVLLLGDDNERRRWEIMTTNKLSTGRPADGTDYPFELDAKSNYVLSRNWYWIENYRAVIKCIKIKLASNQSDCKPFLSAHSMIRLLDDFCYVWNTFDAKDPAIPVTEREKYSSLVQWIISYPHRPGECRHLVNRF